MTNHKVSIITPLYNSEKYITEAIDSVLEQSYTNFELIIIDDCSQDNSVKAVKSYSDVRIRLICLKANKGAGIARNKGIHEATGRYIAFLDSDDTWPDDRLRAVHHEVTKCSSCENTVFYGQVDFKRFDQTEGQKKPTQPLGKPSVSEYLFESNVLIQTSTLVVSRKLAETVKFDERYTRHQDYDFVFRAESIFFAS